MSSNNTYIITEQQRLNFKPTYLYIKQHSITGLKYFGKTTKLDPIKYKGSGEYWKNHIKSHGKTHVDTIWYHLFSDIDQLVSIALALSELYDIVDSELWANLIPENGINGGTTSKQAKARTEQGKNPFSGGTIQRTTQKKLVDDDLHHFLGKAINEYMLKNGTHPSQKQGNSERISKREREKVAAGIHIFTTDEFKKKEKTRQKKLVDDGLHHFLSGKIQSEHNKKLIAAGEHVSQIKCSCIYCKNEFTLLNFDIHHGDNCKLSPIYVPKYYTCEYCDIKTTNKTNIIRYHNDKCKYR